MHFKIDLKPKDPQVFAGKSSEDIELWVKPVKSFLTLIDRPDNTQVVYVANLL